MTSILKKQLTLLGGAAILSGALVWSARESVAQENPFDFLGVFARARENARRSSCQSNLKQIALGYGQYSQDYDERFPPARGWIDVLQPYVRSEQIFTCPALPTGKKYGYAISSKMTGKYLNDFAAPAQTVAIYETQILKRNAFGMGEFRANRHLDGANFAYVDGHVKWLDQTKKPSFNLKP